jgi:hypothetical protein
MVKSEKRERGDREKKKAHKEKRRAEKDNPYFCSICVTDHFQCED